MSPLEVSREFEAARIRREDEASDRLELAWHTARITALAMVGKLPNLSEELKSAKGSKGQTHSEMLAMMRMLAERYGNQVRRAN